MDTQTVVTALGALAQESRLAVFRLLVQQGPEGLKAGAISERVGIPPTTSSFHLSQLSHAGLVRSRRESRSIVYAADYGRMRELMGFLMENCCQASGCGPRVSLEPSPRGRESRTRPKAKRGAAR